MAFSEFRTKDNHLKFSEKQSLSWIDHSPVCTKVVDLDFNLQFMSLSGVQALNIDDITKYYGKPYPLDFYPNFFKNEMLKSLIKARDTGKVLIYEGTIVDLSGKELWFHSTISPICETGDKIDYFIVVSIDTTEQNIARKELEELNDTLEDNINKRTIELQEANKKLYHQSQTDFLTKLPNRLFFDRRIEENIATAQRNRHPLTLLMLDIDNFKSYNDKYGHAIGDIILQKVAKSISSSLRRETDMVARFGGEEFVILLPNTDSNSGLNVAEKIRTNIEKLDIQCEDSNSIINMTVSIGISSLEDNKLNTTNLLKQSDNALYLAKSKGKNNSQVFQIS